MYTLLQRRSLRSYLRVYTNCTLHGYVQHCTNLLYSVHTACVTISVMYRILKRQQRDLFNQIFHKWGYFKPFTQYLKANQVDAPRVVLTFFGYIATNKEA